MKNNEKKAVAVVLGGYVNGFSIIQELHEKGVQDIVLVQYEDQLAQKSNKVKRVFIIQKELNDFRKAIIEIHNEYDFLVLFPSDDLQIEFLKAIEDEISSFAYIPFNSNNIIQVSDKYEQYKFCDALGIPYPKTKIVVDISDLEKCRDLVFPVIVKPNYRKDIVENVFRSLFAESFFELLAKKELLVDFLNRGGQFLVSEFIPGDTTGRIFAFTAFCTKGGKVINGWTGKKLTQFPDDFGVFSSASAEYNSIVESQSRRLIEGMELEGIVEPEYKYDYRDNKYKLTEINLRSMMWHRTGNKSGVFLQYSQWLYATGQEVPEYRQNQKKVIHFSYYKHEFYNLVRRKKYLRKFIYNLFGGDRNYWAVYDRSDLKPFLIDFSLTIKNTIKFLLGRVYRSLIRIFH